VYDDDAHVFFARTLDEAVTGKPLPMDGCVCDAIIGLFRASRVRGRGIQSLSNLDSWRQNTSSQ
jgi:hypothetical protein